MMILRKTFDEDTSGIEVTDGEESYPFRLEGDTAVYTGDKTLPTTVEDEVKNQGYAASIGYDVPATVAGYVENNAGGGGGSGTATETEAPQVGSGSVHSVNDTNGNSKAAIQTFDEGRGIHIANAAPGTMPYAMTGVRSVSTVDGDLVRALLETRVPAGEGPSKPAGVYVDEAGITLEGSSPTYSIEFSTADVSLNQATLRKWRTDVTNLPISPVEGMEAYNDGSTGTAGPAFYDGSSWISLVDGSTIS